MSLNLALLWVVLPTKLTATWCRCVALQIKEENKLLPRPKEPGTASNTSSNTYSFSLLFILYLFSFNLHYEFNNPHVFLL